MLKKYPFYKQLDMVDCGPSCLRMVAKYYGKRYNLETLRRKTFASRQGVSILSLSVASEQLGFRSISAIIPYEELSEIPLPCILHWRRNHFVVLYDVKKEVCTIGDPAFGIKKVGKKDFLKYW